MMLSVTVNGDRFTPNATLITSEAAICAARSGLQNASLGLALKDANDLLNSGYLSMETGYARLDDGQLYVAALTDMPGVTGEMIDWWFAWHDTDRAYTLWHPRDHVSATWRTKPDRTQSWKSQYIGNVSEIVEYIGSNLEHLNVWFAPPERYFDTDRFQQENIATAICARGGQRLEKIWSAHLIHLVRKTQHGVEMRSRFWLGDVDASPKGLVGKLMTPLMNTAAARRRNVPDSLGRDLMLHCCEEMQHLAEFLPQLYRKYA